MRPTRLLTLALATALALAVLAPIASAQVALRNITLHTNRSDYPQPGGDLAYSACWGYVHQDGREYAILGHRSGVSIYNVTDPDNVTFVKYFAGLDSYWREMKSYRNWIYVVTENATTAGGIQPGMQIISMVDPQSPVLVSTYNTNFNRSHTIDIDTTKAILICNGTNYRNPSTGSTTRTGMRILSLSGAGTPTAPVQVGVWPTTAALQANISNYVHDCQPIGNRLYASSIYSGIQRIFDWTTPATPVEIMSWTYAGAYYTHSAWPDAARSRLYICDEQNGQTLRIFDISNETSPVLVNEMTSNPQAIVHNPRVLGNDLWLANYTEGIRALDITDPTHPAEWGYADSWPGASGGYEGVWEVYPYFPSGTIIASDITGGLYVYRANRNYGVVYGHVTHGANSLSGAKVFVEGPGDSALTSTDGTVAFAPNPGTYTIRATKFGYEDATALVTLNQGDHQTVELPLVLKPTGSFSGTVVDANTLAPLSAAEVNLAYTPVHDHTDAAGAYDLGAVPLGTYRLEANRPGYIPVAFDRAIGLPPSTQAIYLSPTTSYDPMRTDLGWTVGGATTGDNATSGLWVRVEPLGTSIGGTQPVLSRRDERGDALLGLGAPPIAGGRAGPLSLLDIGRPRVGPLHGGGEGEGANPGQVQPEFDRSADPESLCWVTGQGTNPTSIEEADVDGPGSVGGKTTLTSPAYNTTGMAQPTIGFWHWFYTQFASPDDWLAVFISNDDGTTWVPVDTLRGLHNHWHEDAIAVADHVAPTAQVRLRFVAADLGEPSVVEAAIDDLTLYDAATPILNVPGASASARLRFRAPIPNPAAGTVTLGLELPRAGRLVVEVFDIGGRRVASLHEGPSHAGPIQLRWEPGSGGVDAPAGIYYARARLGDETTNTLIARVR